MSTGQAQQNHQPVPDRRRIERQPVAGLPGQRGLYDPANEHDACGVGFVARLDGVPHHHVVEDAVQVLINLEHRGAVGGDKATGDGAGLLLQIPDAFFREPCRRHRGSACPNRATTPWAWSSCRPSPPWRSAAWTCWSARPRRGGGRARLARACPATATTWASWHATRSPRIRQVFLARGSVPAEAFERKLYVIRRCVEKEVARLAPARRRAVLRRQPLQPHHRLQGHAHRHAARRRSTRT